MSRSNEELMKVLFDDFYAPEDGRAAFEAEELAGLARRYGGRRVVRDGIGAYEFPPYYCPHCTAIAGPDTLPLPDCPSPLSRHGPIAKRESR